MFKVSFAFFEMEFYTLDIKFLQYQGRKGAIDNLLSLRASIPLMYNTKWMIPNGTNKMA